MEKYIKILNSMKEVSAWKIQTVTKKSCELFYVLDRLETNRATEVTSTNVTIYVDKDEKRGSADFTLYEYMTDAEIEQKIKDNVYAASFAMNLFYEIPEPEEANIARSESNLQEKPFTDLMEELVEAVFAADVYANGYLSATEFFLYETTKHLMNSKGVDVTSTTYSGNVELIPSWEDQDSEVEIYHMMNFESLDAEKITKEVSEQLKMAEARFLAKELEKKDHIKVIIQDEEVGQIFNYFVDDLTYATKYQKSNRCEIGDNVQGDHVTGDKLNVKLVPYYKNAMGSRPFDGDGIILKEVNLIEDGIALRMHGGNRFGYYLGEKKPTGNMPVVVVKEGTKPFAEMAKEPYVRCVKFSGLQVESNSGYFGGEVRLGFYFDGEKEIPVTGFSISGDLTKVRGTMVYSKEEVTCNHYHGPKYLEITDMNIV